ncbi:hypothetical protein FB45DRAFT_1138255 [Roridomyces roridus]|uniref:Uncharacterized protein n=1 Tax=Roridomyces roridus TaxID=1738132 RepID=A0AAD7BAN6_9AGAR|nr:hypothetical protein FB45DRAFT_873638 [Roridomyces roridus]KAJ7636550.1 hypothetical protein FB45DRAFT_1138255 [Roridomyces roridus]
MPEPATWLHALRLPLAFLASLILLTLARRFLPRPALVVPIQVQEKLVAAKTALPAAETPTASHGRFSWLPRLTWETLPAAPVPVMETKSKMPTTTTTTKLNTPLPLPNGRAPTRAGPVRRPEPALAPHLRVGVEAPLPALYSCPPASMAKMTMSRHRISAEPCIVHWGRIPGARKGRTGPPRRSRRAASVAVLVDDVPPPVPTLTPTRTVNIPFFFIIPSENTVGSKEIKVVSNRRCQLSRASNGTNGKKMSKAHALKLSFLFFLVYPHCPGQLGLGSCTVIDASDSSSRLLSPWSLSCAGPSTLPIYSSSLLPTTLRVTVWPSSTSRWALDGPVDLLRSHGYPLCYPSQFRPETDDDTAMALGVTRRHDAVPVPTSRDYAADPSAKETTLLATGPRLFATFRIRPARRWPRSPMPNAFPRESYPEAWINRRFCSSKYRKIAVTFPSGFLCH